MTLTNTWKARLDSGGGWARRAAMFIALVSCSVVAISTIWGWMFSEPLDVDTPTRTAVNRTALVGSYAQDCVQRWLTATQATRSSLTDCWSTRELTLPTTAGAVVDATAVSAVTLVDDLGDRQQWSVVVGVSERAYASAALRQSFYRLPVLWSRYGVRAVTLPAKISGPGAGAEVPLAYSVVAQPNSLVARTVTGFLTSFLTGEGGLERYTSAEAMLIPIADYRTINVTKIQTDHSVPDQEVPAEGSTLRVLAAVTAVTSQYTPANLAYPITLRVSSGRWTVVGLDYGPRLVPGGELTPVLPTAAGPR